jgi:predicted RND superfamily exporter protein
MNQLIRSSICLALLLLSFLVFSDTTLSFSTEQQKSDPFYTKPSNTNTLFNEESQDWLHSKTNKNITIYTRNHKSSNFNAFKAVAKIDQSIESILAVISDPTSCPLWVDNCIESSNYINHQQEKKQFNNRYGYALNHLPWPFKNRDIIVNIVTSNNPNTDEITITMSSDKTLISETDEAVHITDSHAKYILRPIKKNITEFVWIQHTEPAGKLPAWLVNSMIIDLPLNSISKLQEVAKLKKYQDAMIEFDSQKQIQGLKLKLEN